MLKRLLLATAIGAAMATPVLAQDAAAPPVRPPPAEALIASEGATDLRADKLIGASVYNTDGESVGAVEDIVFDRDGKIIGVVVKIGGLLGMGGKPVGIRWDEVKMLPDSRLLQIGYSADQLEAAPAFKTREAIADETELENSRSPQPAQ